MSRLRKQLVERLEALGVEDRPWPDRDDGFSTLHYGGKEFAHFHDDNELDLKLTKKLIAQEGLEHPADSRVHPGRKASSQWIELRFTRAAHLDEVVRLVGLAIEGFR